MANMQYVTENRLDIEADTSSTRTTSIIVFIALFLSLIFSSLWWLFFFFALLLSSSLGRKDAVLVSGAEGEDRTIEILTNLPDSYTVFNQVEIPCDRSSTGVIEIDVIVVGPNGIFVIEVKNNNSHVSGAEKNQKWTAHKIGRRGGTYEADIRNPIKQVKRQVYFLKNYLQKSGNKTWIQSIVFFSHRNCSIELQSETSIPVLTLQDVSLIQYITDFKPKYPPKNIEKTIRELAKLKGL